ncbi:heterokaryon incompatibility protein-domain-containing protein [Hypoxylon argillaceum]|nr:heterokaryon incompatibility protein-domain-containing protein [Hypoxylon argillaceum]
MDDSRPDPSRQESWDDAPRPALASNPVPGTAAEATTIREAGHDYSHGYNQTTSLGNLTSSSEASVSADRVPAFGNYSTQNYANQPTTGIAGGENQDTQADGRSAGSVRARELLLSNIAASQRWRQRMRATGSARMSTPGQGADQASASRPLAPRSGSMRDDSYLIQTNTMGGPWTRTDVPRPTSREPGYDMAPMPTPVSLPPLQPRTIGRPSIEEPLDDPLRAMARQAQDRIDLGQEDRRMQLMLLTQQRQKRLKTGLDEVDGVLQECKGRVDALFSDIVSGRPPADYQLRFQVPRHEYAQQQKYARMDRDTYSVSRTSTGESSTMGQSREASLIAMASRNMGELSAFGKDARGTTYFSSSSGSRAAQPPLKNIRLLQMMPPIDYGQHDTANTVRTPGYSLKDFAYEFCPEYIALSYVWGEESPMNAISVNGAMIRVRTNLAQALASLRESDPDAYIWADAICINQQDDREKSSLVQHMGEIFANAKLVYAWLGPMETDTPNAPTRDLFTQLSELGAMFWAHAGVSEVERLNESSLDLDLILANNLSVLFRKFTQPPGEAKGFPTDEYASLSARPYWSRIWVLQEVFLAKSLYFLCGDYRMPSRTLAGALILIEAFQRYLVRSQSHVRDQLSNSPLTRFTFGLPSFPEMHRLIIYTSIYPLDVVSLRIAMTNFCIKELPRGSRSTDPRDMIYGLLGFANDEERSYIRADYSQSVQETYAAITRSMIRNGFTDVLAWAQPKTKGIAHLPSWVPDYSSTIYETLCSQSQAKPWLPQFKAGGGTTRYTDDAPHPFDRFTLPVRGRRLDEVLWVGRRWFPRARAGDASPSEDDASTSFTRSASYEDLLAYLKEFQDLVWHAEQIHRSAIAAAQDSAAPRRAAAADAAWRVPCCDQVVLDSRPVRGDPAATRRRHEDALRGLEACVGVGGGGGRARELPDAARPYVEALLRPADKRPFLTVRGLVGLGPADVERGDAVVVLDGFSACYVLKGRGGGVGGGSSSSSSSSVGEYRLVGEAFVDGVMDGEMGYSAAEGREWFYLV